MVFTSSMADPWTVKYQDACKLFDVDPSKTAYSGVFEERTKQSFWSSSTPTRLARQVMQATSRVSAKGTPSWSLLQSR